MDSSLGLGTRPHSLAPAKYRTVHHLECLHAVAHFTPTLEDKLKFDNSYFKVLRSKLKLVLGCILVRNW